MKIKDIRKLDDNKIAKEKEKAIKEVLDLKYDHANGELKNTYKICQAKKTVARVKTVINERKGNPKDGTE